MKLFIFVLMISSFAFAKNKVAFSTCVNCVKDSKEEPLYDLQVMSDFKKLGSKVTIESRSKFDYATCDDYLVYIKRGETDKNTLYMVSDYSTFNKLKIAEDVSSFKIKNGILFFERMEKSGDKTIAILYSVTDFKKPNKQEVARGYSNFSLDEY